MRLIAFIVLTSLMVLAFLPQIAGAGSAMHDCPSCAEAMTAPDHQRPERHRMGSPCADMALCAPVAILAENLPLREGGLVRPRHAWPEPRHGATISLSLDPPPPRA